MAAQLQKTADEMNRKKLQGDSSTVEPNNSNMVPSKGTSSPSDAISCVSSIGDASGSLKEGDVDHEYFSTDQNVAYPAAGGYYGYYYPGYGGFFGEQDNQGYYVGADAMDLQYPVMQADNGSYVYLMPGFQTGYSSSYFPMSPTGVDGQYVGHNVYPPGSIFQQPIGSPGYYSASFPYGELLSPTYSWDSPLTIQDGSQGNGYNELAGKPSGRSNLSSQSHTGGIVSKSMPPPNLNNQSAVKGSTPLLEVSPTHVKRNQPKQANKASICGSVLHSDAMVKGCLPVTKFPAYNQGKSGFLYPNNVKANTKSWVSSEKLKPRSKVNDSLNEQNQGPRTANAKGALISGGNSARTLAVDESGNGNSKIGTDQFNLPDFQTKYDHALFFVIKSYSEDDIHKSIKYNVWASTPNGNKRLDSAFQDAQKRMEEKGSKCPIFLFFSVNASGQFCGVAEMIGRVDFDKSMDFWQQDKWNGYFPVRWHIIKDIPNPQLRHIILENNDHKPVTNSRDTQEVNFPQGVEMLNIFKNYAARTSILDDFEFYESRQKVMQDKKIRQSMPHTNIQHIEDLTTALGSVDLSAVTNKEDPKLVEKVSD